MGGEFSTTGGGAVEPVLQAYGEIRWGGAEDHASGLQCTRRSADIGPWAPHVGLSALGGRKGSRGDQPPTTAPEAQQAQQAAFLTEAGVAPSPGTPAPVHSVWTALERGWLQASGASALGGGGGGAARLAGRCHLLEAPCNARSRRLPTHLQVSVGPTALNEICGLRRCCWPPCSASAPWQCGARVRSGHSDWLRAATAQHPAVPPCPPACPSAAAVCQTTVVQAGDTATTIAGRFGLQPGELAGVAGRRRRRRRRAWRPAAVGQLLRPCPCQPPHSISTQLCYANAIHRAVACCHGAAAVEAQLEKCELTAGWKKGDFLQARRCCWRGLSAGLQGASESQAAPTVSRLA